MKTVATNHAPAALGPYAQAQISGGFVFTSGQIGIDPATGVIADGIDAQAHQVFRNLSAVLQAAGSDMSKAVKTTVFIKNMTISPPSTPFMPSISPSRSRPEAALRSRACPRTCSSSARSSPRRKRPHSPFTGSGQIFRYLLSGLCTLTTKCGKLHISLYSSLTIPRLCARMRALLIRAILFSGRSRAAGSTSILREE